jgi:hypothetical protein
MQKGNERKNVGLLGFLKDLAVIGGNEPKEHKEIFHSDRMSRMTGEDRINRKDLKENKDIF